MPRASLTVVENGRQVAFPAGSSAAITVPVDPVAGLVHGTDLTWPAGRAAMVFLTVSQSEAATLSGALAAGGRAPVVSTDMEALSGPKGRPSEAQPASPAATATAATAI